MREGMRVQKYMSRAGAASRRQAEAMIREGRVTINGERVTRMGARVVPGTDVVSLDGRVVKPAPRRWIVLHKPVGVLCTARDPGGGETVYDLLPPWAAGLRYVGRLDRDTSGLLLMTNDGDLAAAWRTRAEGSSANTWRPSRIDSTPGRSSASSVAWNWKTASPALRACAESTGERTSRAS